MQGHKKKWNIDRVLNSHFILLGFISIFYLVYLKAHELSLFISPTFTCGANIFYPFRVKGRVLCTRGSSVPRAPSRTCRLLTQRLRFCPAFLSLQDKGNCYSFGLKRMVKPWIYSNGISHAFRYGTNHLKLQFMKRIINLKIKGSAFISF